MRIFLNTLKVDLKRTTLSKTYFLSFIAYNIIISVLLAQELSGFSPNVSVMYVRLIQQYLGFYIIYLIFAAIPSTPIFCIDWENRFYRYLVIRSTKRHYLISKVLACLVSSFSLIFLSEWFQILVMRIMGLPITDSSFENNLGAYNSFSVANKTYIYLLIVIVIKSLCASFFSVLALWVSTKITNIFVTLATPLLGFQIINTATNALRIPSELSVNKISKAQVVINSSPLQSFIYSISIFLVLIIIFSFLFMKNCNRRIENG